METKELVQRAISLSGYAERCIVVDNLSTKHPDTTGVCPDFWVTHYKYRVTFTGRIKGCRPFSIIVENGEITPEGPSSPADRIIEKVRLMALADHMRRVADQFERDIRNGADIALYDRVIEDMSHVG